MFVDMIKALIEKMQKYFWLRPIARALEEDLRKGTLPAYMDLFSKDVTMGKKQTLSQPMQDYLAKIKGDLRKAVQELVCDQGLAEKLLQRLVDYVTKRALLNKAFELEIIYWQLEAPRLKARRKGGLI